MRAFEKLCQLASSENWCWKLYCTTCGHLHFRYAFLELAEGISPEDPSWQIHSSKTDYSSALGALPRNYSSIQKKNICKTCSNADLSRISSSCKFPNWLGYLGLVLEHMKSDSEFYRDLSRSWASQLLNIVPEDDQLHHKLTKMASGQDLLKINDLESLESFITHNKQKQADA